MHFLKKMTKLRRMMSKRGKKTMMKIKKIMMLIKIGMNQLGLIWGLPKKESNEKEKGNLKN